jgi:beta-galactosidase/beta-glucuronidase
VEFSPDPSGEYRLRFPAAPDQAGHPFLVFDGMDFDAEVWLNGEYLGFHAGGFEPFAFPVTLQAENLLAVRAPAMPGAVSLVCRPQLYVASLRVTPYLAAGYGQADLVVQIAVENYGDRPITEPLRILVAPHNFAGGGGVRHPLIVTFPPGRSEHTFTVTLKRPELWWTPDLGAPSLYKAMILVGGEAVPQAETLFGVREFRQDADGALSLNGRRVATAMVRPVPRVEESEFYQRCDAEGVLLCQSLLCAQGGAPTAWALAQAAVRRVHHHPSVVMFSANSGSPQLDQALMRAAAALDRTRPVVTGN